MPDREKVIKGLEECAGNGNCTKCRYGKEKQALSCKKLLADAIALLNDYDTQLQYRDDHIAEYEKEIKRLEGLLKEQKKDGSFIVIDSQTGKEADQYNIALHEDWAKHLCYCDMDGWAIQDDGSLLLLDECGRYAYADRERFKVVWDA